jgi:hypothetical protein
LSLKQTPYIAVSIDLHQADALKAQSTGMQLLGMKTLQMEKWKMNKVIGAWDGSVQREKGLD